MEYITYSYILCSLIDLSQYDIQVLYDLQIYNGICTPLGLLQLTAAELEFLRTSSLSMVSILDLLQRFSFQFIKNGSVAM